MTLLDVYEQVKLVKAEVFPFYIELNSPLKIHRYICLALTDNVHGFLFVDEHSYRQYSWISNTIELVFLDEMIGHYLYPKDEHNNEFKNKFNRLLK